jgi:hypothetical protein
MAISINSATQAQPRVAAQPTQERQPVAAQAQARVPVQPAATVNISAAAQARQETAESQAQTAGAANSAAQLKQVVSEEATAK